MTRLTYDIMLHNRKVKNVTTLAEAASIVESLGRGWTYKAVYTEFDPADTPEYREACRRMREKRAQHLALKRYEKELAHAPAYVNISGVGAS